jgi:hypothetical protein
LKLAEEGLGRFSRQQGAPVTAAAASRYYQVLSRPVVVYNRRYSIILNRNGGNIGRIQPGFPAG